MCNVKCQMSNVKCQMSNVKCQMSYVKRQMSKIKCKMLIKLNFCRSVPPELLWSFFKLQCFLVTPISARYGLLVEEATEYKAGVQPDIINSFASAAFRCWLDIYIQDKDDICSRFLGADIQDKDDICSRFGHSMINSMFMLVSQRKPRNQVTK